MSVENIVARMQIQILELVDRQAVILSESDQEFIMGLAMLMEMEERLDVQYAPRVAAIYQQVVTQTI